MNKHIDAPNSTIARDTRTLETTTQNLYESVVIIGKRANQLSAQLKEELNAKLDEFASDTDNLEEIFENREQIEISKYYESLPKPTLMATEEFLNGQVYFRKPSKDAE
ncbi:MAG: DNA-directed RNA polymerase subunit K/omega [Bacteroidia bacterium]|jgi:DNA-directed RNA polymerase subunit K/omega